MTPERQAADAIARATCAEDGGDDFDRLDAGSRAQYSRYGIAGVEALSAAGLVVMTAARAAKLLEVEAAHAG